MIDLRFRPFDAYPYTSIIIRRNGTFRVTYTVALDHLEKEIEAISGRGINIATGHRMQDIRNDGWPRSDAKRPIHPGVVLYCESKHGSLAFAFDTYTEWKDNLRAIGLTLENLRAVERYGATRHGEQYKGYAQIPVVDASSANGYSPADAARILLHYAGKDAMPADIASVMGSTSHRRLIYTVAVRRAHPDHGGTDNSFMQVQEALKVLNGS